MRAAPGPAQASDPSDRVAHAASQARAGRNAGVDLARVLALLAVIAIHSGPFESAGAPRGASMDLATIINQLARFAVPLFFVLSGYYWAAAVAAHGSLAGPSQLMARRIGIAFVAWSLVYLLPTNLLAAAQLGPLELLRGNLRALGNTLVNAPWTVLLEGSKGHLWFLPALLCCLGISAALLARGLVRSLGLLAGLLYLLGLAAKAWHDTPLGLDAGFDLRDGPFFGLAFFASGCWLQRLGPRPSWLAWGALLLGLGFALHFSELLWLHQRWGTNMAQDFVVGTYAVGIGAAMMALANPRWLGAVPAEGIGRLALGIYASHVLFIECLYPLRRLLTHVPAWPLLEWLLVFLLAWAASLALARWRWTRPLVA